jgi:hypothetical protein
MSTAFANLTNNIVRNSAYNRAAGGLRGRQNQWEPQNQWASQGNQWASQGRRWAGSGGSFYNDPTAQNEAANKQKNYYSETRDTDSQVRVSKIQNDAQAARDKADLDVWESDQAMADGKAQSRNALASLNRRREVGGGSFARANRGRSSVVIGSGGSGGLDAINRQAAKKAREAAINTKYGSANQALSRTAQETNNRAFIRYISY